MKLKHPIRIVTGTSLFDGHDVTINIIRRMLQDAGVEVIHLGHNRSVQEVTLAALQEGVQSVAISSYQGGHIEYYKYLRDFLNQQGASFVRIFGGGGGVIIHEEKAEIEAYGISKIFHPEDGRRLGLQGMIEEILRESDFDPVASCKGEGGDILGDGIPHGAIGMAITALENGAKIPSQLRSALGTFQKLKQAIPPVIGVTGTGGAGKSSLVDELLRRFSLQFPEKRVAALCVDPTKKSTGGALLGDRIRMNILGRPGIFLRSLASRGSGSELAARLPEILEFIKGLQFDLIFLETSGIGQSASAIAQVADHKIYVMTSEFGAQTQLEKIDMIDFADLVAINKADHGGARDALRDVRTQYRRSRKIFDEKVSLPVFLTQASQFNDSGVNEFFSALCDRLGWSGNGPLGHLTTVHQVVIPSERQNYLAEVVRHVRDYKKHTEKVAEKFSILGSLETAAEQVPQAKPYLASVAERERLALGSAEGDLLTEYDSLLKDYGQSQYVYEVRGRRFEQSLVRETLSGLTLRRVVVPKFFDLGDRYRYMRMENVPGRFPFTAGVFPLKREGEDPERQFAGEGPPEKTNRRFHYLTRESQAKRLSTAFDSVTLYGQDPDRRPDIFGKIGESGVSIATLEDMEKLYQGFDLCDPATSISMTINGPAPMMLAFFFNTAINQQLARKEKELGRKLSLEESENLKKETLTQVRGTVQADILKEDQGQNTCIFSIDFALKLMGDVQEYFIANNVRNFYSVSISGYHIAEAGANPITQLAFTLANGFTYVEYYLARGMNIDDFAPNLSFFFSNGLDPEYSVLGRVARRIWAIALKEIYGGNERSQKLKYHIQTSGRSLHSQEIQFNDIRTTLQALSAVYDNCNSLHTNAFDEAITTPTEHSVRRALAIQKIINSEFGLTKSENLLQGSYCFQELTDLVEEAVLTEFLRLNERGGVLGAMERQYQRSRIQQESLHYEHLKDNGQLPIIGVNTFLDPKGLESLPAKIELARATPQEKESQLRELEKFQQKQSAHSAKALERLKQVALSGGNVFAELMSAARVCSLYQLTQALYEVGGQYRRNI